MRKTLYWICLMVLMVCLAGCSAPTQTGEKTVTVEVVYADQTEQECVIHTDAVYLAEALAEQRLITYDESGLYTTVAGVTADFDKDGAWWCVTKNGMMTTQGMNTQPIADGEHYEITYTVS